MRNSVGFGRVCRAEESRTNQTDLDEVIEVSRLQRSVLPVIGEAEQLPGFGLQFPVAPKATNGCKTQDRRRTRPPTGSKGHELAEITRLPATVRDAAAQAEPKR